MTEAKKTDYNISTYTDEKGRNFHYVFFPSKTASKKLVIHFTAFFGDWGDQKQFKATYQGYFHRLRMLRDQSEYNLLFLCDQFGATKNGTYYCGEHGDMFVERAMKHIISDVMTKNSLSPQETVTIGSSMGATGALKFGLMFQVKAIIAISPHIDLDICAAKQGRELHVNFVVADGDAYSESSKPVTRQIRLMVQNWDEKNKLPRLFIHSCKDDHGVHEEQVLPILNLWTKKRGASVFDERPLGGHGSDYCTKAVIVDVLKRLFADAEIPVLQYQTVRKFFPDDERLLKLRLKKAVRKWLSRCKKAAKIVLQKA